MQATLWRPSDIVGSEGSPTTEVDAPKRRGRIPHAAWPQILQRHRAGATLSELAREFDCTPSAISYIVRKAEAMERRQTSGQDQGAGDVQDPMETAQPEPREPMAVSKPETTSVPPAPAQAESNVRLRRTEGGHAPTLRADRLSGMRGDGPRQDMRRNDAPQFDDPGPAPVRPMPQRAEPGMAGPSGGGGPRQAPAPAEPGQSGDELEARVRDGARSCAEAYRAWRQGPTEGTEQALRETVHEMRKALARIEIEMSAGRGDDRALKPIPIPAHRAARRAR